MRPRSVSSYCLGPSTSRLARLPICFRCGRYWETCVHYDPAGCVGVPLPPEIRPIRTAAERDYMQSLDRYRLKVAGGR